MAIQMNWEHQLLAMAGHDSHPTHRPFFSYWAGDDSLRQAYSLAERIAAEHSKSFSLASSLLPEEKRAAVRALYAFCRTVDDIVDESAAWDRDRQLDYWRTIVNTTSAPEGDLVAAAWVDAMTRYHIPRHYALQLIDGVARDLSQSRYATFDDLATYCYGVASTVGLMSMHIIGFRGRQAIPQAIKLGVALQLTNILRDVGEDYRNGRVYLPREDMLAFGISETDIQMGVVTPRWRKFMQFQIERARKLYEEAWQGIAMLDRDGRMAIGASAVFYSGILDDIEAHDYDVFHRRANLSAWEKIRRIPALWFKVRAL
ncbi:MAG: phytoene/squalene synthase family protein [Chloroflexota bacterium]